MPQLDSSTFASQIFWLIITFLSLWFCLSFFIVPKVAQIVERRQNKIDDYVQKAELINKQALDTLENYQNAISKAKIEAQEEAAAQRQMLAADIELKKAEVKQALDEKISFNEHRLTLERAEVIEAIDDIASKTASLIVEKLGLKDKTSV